MLNPGSVPNVSDYIAETSYGKASYAADVYGPFVLATGYNCSQVDGMIAAALQAAVNSGLDTSKYNRFVFPFPSTACTYDGLASSGPNTPLINHEWTWVTFPIQPSETNTTAGFAQKFLVMSHEFGHNLGMGHSNTIDFGPLALGPIEFAATNPGTVDPGGPSHPSTAETAVTVAANGTAITGINDEYGDPYPIMAGVGYTPYNAEHRYGVLGWIGADGERDVTASGTFSVAPTENTTGLRALHVLRDAVSNSWVWVEFHQPNSTYTNFGIPYLAMPNTLTSGAELLYSTSYLDGSHTYLIDTTPVGKPNNFADATLANGLSWSDPYSLLTITSGSQTNSALGVTVSYDAACATPTLSTSSVPATAGTGMVTVTAATGCAWTVSSNASWITIPTASGTGNGSASFIYAANSSTVERRTYLTTARQSLPLLQQGTAVNVLSVTPNSTTVAPSVFTPIAFNINNAGGTGANSSFYATVGSLSPITGLKACYIGAEPQPGNDPSNYGIFTFGTGDSIIGSAETVTIGACTIDLSKSTFTSNGSSATLTLSMSFPAGFTGGHPIAVSNDNVNFLNMGYVNVGAPNFTTSTSITASPTTITDSQSTTVVATVTAVPPVGYTGTIPTVDGVFTLNTTLGTCTLSGGTCSITLPGSSLHSGGNNLQGTYNGTTTYPQSTSAPVLVTVTYANPVKSAITSPAPGSTFTGSSATFSWTSGTGVVATVLYVGSSAGSSDIYSGNPTTVGSLTVGNLPINGSTVYVRLYSTINGSYQFNDYTYTAMAQAVTPVTKAAITSPAPSSTLTDSSATFTWTTGTGVGQYEVYVGTYVGGSNIYSGNPMYSTSLTVNGLPTDGSTVYVRLWSRANNTWSFNDYSYTSMSHPVTSAAITSPAPGSTLTDSSATFNWTTGTGVGQYEIYVGTQPGSSDIYSGNPIYSTSLTVNGLPTNGSTIYVRLWSRANNAWTSTDASYQTLAP